MIGRQCLLLMMLKNGTVHTGRVDKSRSSRKYHFIFSHEMVSQVQGKTEENTILTCSRGTVTACHRGGTQGQGHGRPREQAQPARQGAESKDPWASTFMGVRVRHTKRVMDLLVCLNITRASQVAQW